MVQNEGDRLARVIVCSPRSEYFATRDLAVHNIAQPAEKEEAVKQHQILTSLITDQGCEVIDIPELTGHPNSVFTRDTAVSTPQGYITMRMGLATRRGEEEWVSRTLKEKGEKCAGVIRAPGSVEGGDVILAGKVAFVGHSQRTNINGIQQLKKLLGAMGYEVRVADIPSPRLHIGGAMSMIAPDRILCCRSVFPDDFFKGFEIVGVASDTFISGNVLCLSANNIIVEKENSEVIAALGEKHVILHILDLSEFVKGRGGPTCLTMPIHRHPQ